MLVINYDRISWVNALPVNGDIVLDMVDDLNDYTIIFSCNNFRPGELSVHRHDAPGAAQSRNIFPLYLEKQAIHQNQVNH